MQKYICALFLLVASSNFYAQKATNTFTLQELRAKLRKGTYTDKALEGFQKILAGLRQRPILNEELPGEVVSWDLFLNEFSIHKAYLIRKDKVTEVATLPSDPVFLKKLNSYVPEKSRFAYLSDNWSFPLVKEKLKDNYYLIKVTVKSYNPYPEIPNDDILVYDLEYKTRDFKDFRLVRLKDTHTETWTDVPTY